MNTPQHDPVNHPAHYTTHPSGVECITITRHMGFCLGNAVKYLWRAGLKDSAPPIQDLKKAVWYIQEEIKLRELGTSAAEPDLSEKLPTFSDRTDRFAEGLVQAGEKSGIRYAEDGVVATCTQCGHTGIVRTQDNDPTLPATSPGQTCSTTHPE